MQKGHIIKNMTDQDLRENYNTLTKREREIVSMVVEGLTNQEIADKLFVNIRTVETHKTNILQKLQIKNSAFSQAISPFPLKSTLCPSLVCGSISLRATPLTMLL